MEIARLQDSTASDTPSTMDPMENALRFREGICYIYLR